MNYEESLKTKNRLYNLNTNTFKLYPLIVGLIFFVLYWPSLKLLNLIYPATKQLDLTLSVWITFILLAIGLSLVWMIIHIFITYLSFFITTKSKPAFSPTLFGIKFNKTVYLKRWIWVLIYLLNIILVFVFPVLLSILFWPLNDVVFIIFMSFIVYLASQYPFIYFLIRSLGYKKGIIRFSDNELVFFAEKNSK